MSSLVGGVCWTGPPGTTVSEMSSDGKDILVETAGSAVFRVALNRERRLGAVGVGGATESGGADLSMTSSLIAVSLDFKIEGGGDVDFDRSGAISKSSAKATFFFTAFFLGASSVGSTPDGAS